MLCGLTSQLPLYVKNARLIWSGSLNRPAACVPLFHRVVSFHDSTNARDVMVTNNQFYHGVYFKDLETFQRFLVFTFFYSVAYWSGVMNLGPVDVFYQKGSIERLSKIGVFVTSCRQYTCPLCYFSAVKTSGSQTVRFRVVLHKQVKRTRRTAFFGCFIRLRENSKAYACANFEGTVRSQFVGART